MHFSDCNRLRFLARTFHGYSGSAPKSRRRIYRSPDSVTINLWNKTTREQKTLERQNPVSSIQPRIFSGFSRCMSLKRIKRKSGVEDGKNERWRTSFSGGRGCDHQLGLVDLTGASER